VIDYSVSLHQF